MTREEIILAYANTTFGKRTTENIALKLGEEVGEVLRAVGRFQEGRGTESAIADEIGDVLIALSQLAAMGGWSLDLLLTQRFNEIRKRQIDYGPHKVVDGHPVKQ